MSPVRSYLRPAFLIRALVVAGFAWITPSTVAENPSLPQRIYVWQRAWNPAFQQSVAADAGDFAALDVLVAEVSWRNSKPEIHRLAVHWPSLQASLRPIGMVVRIGPYAGTWAADTVVTHSIVELCQSVLAEAHHQGIEPVELQLDFDAATARLTAYRTLLQVIRRTVRPPRLVITALPDWLHSPVFPELIAETDCYVLQVHALEKPRLVNDPYTLCDQVQVSKWVERAAGLNRPFRIALPA